jgi:hypothetical protein
MVPLRFNIILHETIDTVLSVSHESSHESSTSRVKVQKVHKETKMTNTNEKFISKTAAKKWFQTTESFM